MLELGRGGDHWWRVQITPLGACSVLAAFGGHHRPEGGTSIRCAPPSSLNREILAGLQEGVVVVDMDACVVVANEAAAALFGVPLGRALGNRAERHPSSTCSTTAGTCWARDRLPLMRALQG